MTTNKKLDTHLLRRAFQSKDGKNWFEFTRTECFVCGRIGHCLVHEDGKTVACTRVESDKLFSKRHTSYLHILEDGVKIDTTKLAEISNREKVDNNILNGGYRAFLDKMSIADNHMHHLKVDRQLSAETIQARKYRSYGQDSVANAKALLGERLYEDDRFKDAKMKYGIPGLFLNKEDVWEMVKHDGILIPYRNRHMEIVGFQVRATEIKNRVAADSTNFEGLHVRIKEQPDLVQVCEFGEIVQEFRLGAGKSAVVKHGDKETNVKVIKGQRYLWVSSNKYKFGTPASTQDSPLPVHVAVPTKDLIEYEKLAEQQAQADSYLVNVESDSVWITEGALKADLAVDLIAEAYENESEVGKVVLAVPGVNTWQTVIPTLKEMKVKRVNLAFDMDAATNQDVLKQYFDMIRYLYQEGYEVYVAKWSVEVAKGLDDLLQKNYKPQLQRIQPTK